MGKFNKKKSSISQEKAEEIIKMSNDDLSRSVSGEWADIVALEKEKKESEQIKNLTAIYNELKAKIEEMEEFKIVKAAADAAKEVMEDVREKLEDKAMEDAKEDLKALREGYTNELRERRKRLNFMLDEMKKRYGTRG